MSNVLHFAKMDMLSFKPYYKYLLMLPLALLCIFQPPVLSAQLIIFFLVTALSPYLFASEDRSGMHKLYALLPINAKEIVYGRYVCSIAGALAYIAAMTIILCFCTIYTGLSVATVLFSMIACTGLVFVSIAVQFPIFFKVGFIRGKFAAIVPAFALLGFVFACRAIIGIDFLSEVAVFSGLSSIIFLAVGIVAIIISVSISIKIYQAREK